VSATQLTVRRSSGSYAGNVTGSDTAAYNIRPGIQIMGFDPPNNSSNIVVCGYSAFVGNGAFANGSSVECAHNNETAVYGSIIRLQPQTIGSSVGAGYFLNNTGPVTCGDGFIADSTGSGAGGYIRCFRAKGASQNPYYADACTGVLLTAGNTSVPLTLIQVLNTGGTGNYNLRCRATTATRVVYLPDQAGNVNVGQNVTLAYSASMTPDAALGSYQVVTVTDANAMAINLPLHPFAGQFLTFEINNATAAAIGAMTWNAGFLLVGGSATWTQPGAGKRRTILFEYNGTNWVEQCRASGDI
jgi:hypothetical protein